jgi:GNAT superfamily N-acetyltransferase
MEVREATHQDIPAVVSLLKLSLGESLMPKSERYWQWKHIENPFGRSPVLLCFEGSLLIGVRAFMRWEWRYNGRVHDAVRAVDTATHPDHQGKGIFKKLTLALVDYCKQHGVQFVFNTPNEQSKPGYMKMGWEEAGRLPIWINIQRPFRILKNVIASPAVNSVESNSNGLRKILKDTRISQLVEVHRGQMDSMTTNISVPYLEWRYADVPVAQYDAIGVEHNGRLTGLIIARIKTTRLGRELRITDCFLDKDVTGKELIDCLNKKRREWSIDYTTLSGSVLADSKKILSGLKFSAAVGPTVTVRPLGLSDLSDMKNFKNWSPSLGDLELF